MNISYNLIIYNNIFWVIINNKYNSFHNAAARHVEPVWYRTAAQRRPDACVSATFARDEVVRELRNGREASFVSTLPPGPEYDAYHVDVWVAISDTLGARVVQHIERTQVGRRTGGQAGRWAG